ncbi:MAG: hypothetical protein JWM16_3527 [Verrucomicrobiales bacterium]|nr:hypothetical protein [Verrucomicrobiales bacterium]
MKRITFGLRLAALGVLVALGFLFWLAQDKPEPVYEDRKLSEWVLLMDSRVSHGKPPGADAEAAIHAIGTNGFELYFAWIEFKPTILQSLFGGSSSSGTDRLEKPAHGASMAFGILGSEAQDAIPRLVRDSSTMYPPCMCYRAIHCLEEIREPAVSAFLTLMTNSDVNVRKLGTFSARVVGDNGLVQKQLHVLRNDSNAEVREAATNSLYDRHPYPREWEAR